MTILKLILVIVFLVVNSIPMATFLAVILIASILLLDLTKKYISRLMSILTQNISNPFLYKDGLVLLIARVYYYALAGIKDSNINFYYPAPLISSNPVVAG